jgi:hypothetical protein
VFERWWKVTQEMIMNRLSGWMRIWIVLSVIFFFISGWYGLGKRGDESLRIYDIFYKSCSLSKPKPETIFVDCSKYASEKRIEHDIGSPLIWIFFYSILPLILLWFFGFISYKVFIWIKKGFITQNHKTE